MGFHALPSISASTSTHWLFFPTPLGSDSGGERVRMGHVTPGGVCVCTRTHLCTHTHIHMCVTAVILEFFLSCLAPETLSILPLNLGCLSTTSPYLMGLPSPLAVVLLGRLSAVSGWTLLLDPCLLPRAHTAVPYSWWRLKLLPSKPF